MSNPITCAHCGHTKSKDWHLVCDECWPHIPEHLQRELIESHAEQVGSMRHSHAIERVLTALGKMRPMNVFEPIKGMVHVCTVRSDDGWEAMCCLWDGERWLYWDNELEPRGWEPVTDMNCTIEAWDLPCMPMAGKSLVALLVEAREAIENLHGHGDFRNHNTDATGSIDEGLVQTADFVRHICNKIDCAIAGFNRASSSQRESND